MLTLRVVAIKEKCYLQSLTNAVGLHNIHVTVNDLTYKVSKNYYIKTSNQKISCKMLLRATIIVSNYK